ncbi:GNAT family acetyltransferase [Desulfoluna sp.]|uniref:GNAT family acetyltransferase n=1 Tax=Desulfoluna sp. TaxID=2045199 RepID=UPI00262D6E85|nr:GNAT family acetyltransferase [Desulfoluna sp.]
MDIRSYHSSDSEAVIRLWGLCGLAVPQNNPEKDIERKLKVNPEWFLVGEEGGRIVSTCMVGYEGHRGWINYLAVHPELQGSGLGAVMMRRAEDLMRQVGCSKINLQIRSTHEAVIQFYKGVGYTQDPVVSMGKRLVSDVPDQDAD